MRDPYVVLSEKQERATRVRKEIEALLLVIPLLIEETPSWEEIQSSLPTGDSCRRDTIPDGMEELRLYFPFVKHLSLDPGTVG